MSNPRNDELRSKPIAIADLAAMIENTRGLTQGVTLEAEMLTSIAISQKRIADILHELTRHIILGARP